MNSTIMQDIKLTVKINKIDLMTSRKQASSLNCYQPAAPSQRDNKSILTVLSDKERSVIQRIIEGKADTRP